MTKAKIVSLLASTLKIVQKKMWKSFFAIIGRKFVIHCSRRLGKTYLLAVLAICMAINKTNAQIRYATATQKSARKIIHPIFKELFFKIPQKYRGKWDRFESAYIFKNGSMIHLCGVNNAHEDDLRGTSADLCIVDEAAFIDQLSYLVDSVLIPQLITTGGKLIMASSSPLSPAHEFTSYIADAKLNGYYASYDIWEGDYDLDLIDEFCKEAGGPNSTTWRREYLNELIVDEEMSIIPEWQSKYVSPVVRNEFYEFYHKYESADWGVRDNTAILFGHYDFKQAKLKIEQEFILSGAKTTTKNISDEVDIIETDLGWREVYRRIGDNNEIIIMQDLGTTYSKHFNPTTKDSLAAMVNEVRLWVNDGRIQINPKCKNLIGCLEFGVFQDKKRNEFGRSKDYGHYDALASLMYMVRNIDQSTNPIPIDYGVDKRDAWIPEKEKDTQTIATFKTIFNRGKVI